MTLQYASIFSPKGLSSPGKPASSLDRHDSRTQQATGPGILPRTRTAWSGMALLATLLLLTSPCRGQELPDPLQAVHAWSQVREWLDTYDAPSLQDEAALLPLDGVTGVCVILRNSGRIAGSGIAMTGSTSPELLCRKAAGRAMSQALGDRIVSVLRQELGDAIGTFLTLELEIAGALVPLPGRTWERIATQVEPGIDGMALTWASRVKMLFPSEMLSMNRASTVDRALLGLVAEAGLPARAYGDLRAEQQLRVHRFRTIHLAQSTPDGRPFESLRGERLVPYHSHDEKAVLDAAHRLADHLLSTCIQELHGAGTMTLLGDYEPVPDVHRPLVASARDQALAAFALAGFADLPHVLHGSRYRLGAWSLLADLAARLENEPLADDLETCAALVYALSVLPQEPPAGGQDWGRAALAARAREGLAQVDGHTTPRSIPGQALVIGARARVLLDNPGSTGQDIRTLMDSIWKETPVGQRTGLMPWIAWAAEDLAPAGGGLKPHIVDMRALRTALQSAQLTLSVPGVPHDVLGGMAIHSHRLPAADARSLPSIVFLAWSLLHEDMTPRSRLGMDRMVVRRAMRFLMQLQVHESEEWAFQSAAAVHGGLQIASWDNRQPAAAQVMGLLAFSEMLLGSSISSPEP